MTHSTTRTIPSSQDGEKLLVILEEPQSPQFSVLTTTLLLADMRDSIKDLASVYLPIYHLSTYL